MSILDDILNTSKDIASATGNAITGTSPQSASSTPTISSSPAQPQSAPGWTAPDAGGNGQFSVHRDTLSTVAKRIQSDLAALDSKVKEVQSASNDFGSLEGWPTGASFAANAAIASRSIAQAGTQAGDAQNTAAKHLNDSAASYEAAEHFNTQNVYLVNDNLQSAGGSVSAASSMGQAV